MGESPCLLGSNLVSSIADIIFFFATPCGILVPWPGIEPVRSAMGEQSLNHWTTREVPTLSFFFPLKCRWLFICPLSKPKKWKTRHPGLEDLETHTANKGACPDPLPRPNLHLFPMWNGSLLPSWSQPFLYIRLERKLLPSLVFFTTSHNEAETSLTQRYGPHLIFKVGSGIPGWLDFFQI